jgi:hypothetical protein
VLTELGAEVVDSDEVCACDEEVENLGVFACPECGTVNDLVLGWYAVRRRTWEVARFYA